MNQEFKTISRNEDLLIHRNDDDGLNRIKIEAITQEWQKRLYLSHWSLKFDWDNMLDPNEENPGEAEIVRQEMLDYAFVRFNPQCFTWDREYANKVIVHELLHLSTRDLEFAVESIEPHIPIKADYEIFEDRIHWEQEACIDRLATILVELGGVV